MKAKYFAYKQGVTGSNPVSPTLKNKRLQRLKFVAVFYLHKICIKLIYYFACFPQKLFKKII